MTNIRSLERTWLDNSPWNEAHIKLVARSLPALYAMRTVKLSIVMDAPFLGSTSGEVTAPYLICK
ncbi:MAG TPA: hypothetical protein VJ302_25930 [Blastocatellia bacterium]|nr:hypothetical protein [Blastocatellia bacterium]